MAALRAEILDFLLPLLLTMHSVWQLHQCKTRIPHDVLDMRRRMAMILNYQSGIAVAICMACYHVGMLALARMGETIILLWLLLITMGVSLAALAGPRVTTVVWAVCADHRWRQRLWRAHTQSRKHACVHMTDLFWQSPYHIWHPNLLAASPARRALAYYTGPALNTVMQAWAITYYIAAMMI